MSYRLYIICRSAKLTLCRIRRSNCQLNAFNEIHCLMCVCSRVFTLPAPPTTSSAFEENFLLRYWPVAVCYWPTTVKTRRSYCQPDSQLSVRTTQTRSDGTMMSRQFSLTNDIILSVLCRNCIVIILFALSTLAWSL